MKNTKIIIPVLILVLIIGAFFVFFPKQNENEIVKIGYLPMTASMPLFVAQEKGYFLEQNIKVELIEFQTSNQLTEALVRGDIQVEAASSSSVTATILQKDPNALKVFMVNSFDKENSISALIIKKDSNISSVAELKGKKVGSFPGSTTTAHARIYLEQNNAYDKNTQIIELAPGLQLQALSSGSVDAIMSLEPIPTIGRMKNISKTLVHALIETEVLVPFIGGSYSFNKDFADTATSSKIVIAMEKAVNFMRENPEESRPLLVEYTPLEQDISSEVPLPNTLKLDEIDIENFQMMVAFLIKEKILSSQINISNAIYERR
ncbi:ABC transporter substrate-binding protein [Candidatus Woesearchaeota archaeon]|mgnify:FL=1|jgi:NitT/TauT family transport system substrate-binding protein|nr:ABC transporter substrate-binding protein [Candidatus Neomarinimicrobiota bacterium]MBT7627840.1 ABC transporter substrate-binding protein [Candidatus Woesearchaeota archaeon]